MDNVKQFGKDLLETIKNKFKELAQSFKNGLINIKNKFIKLGQSIKAFPGKTKQVITDFKANPKEYSSTKFKDAKAHVKKKTSLRTNDNWFNKIARLALYFILIVISYIFLSPIIEMVSKSFMSTKDLINPEVFFLPTELTFANFSFALEVMSFWKALFNSVWFSATLAILQVIVSALTAYAFARYNFKGKKIWFGVLIIVFILPTPVLINSRQIMFSNFQTATGIQVMGTFLPIMMMTLLGQGVYSTILILIFYNFFKQIPYDLDEAAYMDGATSFGVFYHVILKLSMPIIFTIFLFSFVWNWNESLQTALFLDPNFILLPKQLSVFNALGLGQMNEGFKMAGTLLSILPLIILYLFVQRKFIEGIEQTGITGV